MRLMYLFHLDLTVEKRRNFGRHGPTFPSTSSVSVKVNLNGFSKTFRIEKEQEMLGNIKVQAVALVFMLFLTIAVGPEQCQKLQASLFPNCIKAGIDATIRDPSTKGTEDLTFKSNLTKRTINELKRCSPFIDFLVCSVSTPKCMKGRMDGPLLPCRRVCTDVLRGCGVFGVSRGDVEWMKGLCTLLPDEDPKTGKCIEPKNFKLRHKNVPLQQKCSKLFLPQCLGFGYNYTTQNFIEQLWMGQHFDSILNHTLLNYTVCEPVLRELLCTELIPPCFKENQSEPAIYTVCKPKCQILWNNCLAVIEKEFGIFEDCTMAAEEETQYKGFCRVTKWPGSSKWTKAADSLHVLGWTSSSQGSGISAGVLTISVCITIMLALFAFGAYSVFKRKGIFKLRGYYRHQEEEEEEMTVVVPA